MKRILTTIALAASLAASVAVADTKTQDTSAAHHPVVTSEKMKMEQRGINIMRDIQYARLTLFSGDTEGAAYFHERRSLNNPLCQHSCRLDFYTGERLCPHMQYQLI